jgi:hypothetical protein
MRHTVAAYGGPYDHRKRNNQRSPSDYYIRSRIDLLLSVRSILSWWLYLLRFRRSLLGRSGGSVICLRRSHYNSSADYLEPFG